MRKNKLFVLHTVRVIRKVTLSFGPWSDSLVLVSSPIRCNWEVSEIGHHCFMKLGISLENLHDLTFKKA